MTEALALAWKLASALSKLIGVKGYIILALLAALAGQRIYYDGVSLPWLGHLVDGRVQSYAETQVSIARASAETICNGKLEKLVSGAELAAANARADRLQQDVIAAQLAREAAERQSDELQTQKLEAQKALDDRIASDDAALKDKPGDNRSHWTADDLKWMHPDGRE